MALKSERSASQTKSSFLANDEPRRSTPSSASPQLVRDELFRFHRQSKYREYLADIRRASSTTFSTSPRSGPTRSRWRRTGPCDFIEDAIRVARPSRRRRVLAGVPTPTTARRGSMSTPRMMRQAVINLLSNAIKHNAPGEPVTVRTALTAEGALRIEVTDPARAFRCTCWARLRRIRTGRQCLCPRKQGTGLGLALVRAFVKAHEGKVWLERRRRRRRRRRSSNCRARGGRAALAAA